MHEHQTPRARHERTSANEHATSTSTRRAAPDAAAHEHERTSTPDAHARRVMSSARAARRVMSTAAADRPLTSQERRFRRERRERVERTKFADSWQSYLQDAMFGERDDWDTNEDAYERLCKRLGER